MSFLTIIMVTVRLGKLGERENHKVKQWPNDKFSQIFSTVQLLIKPFLFTRTMNMTLPVTACPMARSELVHPWSGFFPKWSFSLATKRWWIMTDKRWSYGQVVIEFEQKCTIWPFYYHIWVWDFLSVQLNIGDLAFASKFHCEHIFIPAMMAGLVSNN